MQATWISSRDLNGRITAGQFLSSSLRSMDKIKSGEYQTCSISKIGKVRGGKRLPPNSRYVTDGIPYVRSTDIRDLRVDFSQVVRISIEHQKIIANYPLEYQDVVVGIAGTIGTIGLVDENVGPCHFNENLARITDIQINPAYLAVFLDSEFGQAFIDYLKGGAVQPKLSLININRIQVPLPPRDVQDRIAGVMQAAYAARREKLAEAERLLGEVDSLVFGKLNLSPESVREETRFLKPVSALQSGRFDVAFNMGFHKFDPYADRVAQVGDVVLFSKETKNPTKEPNTSFRYIDISSINIVTGEIGEPSEMLGQEAPSRARQLVHAGDILVSTVRPTRGAIAIVPPEMEGFICSTGFAVIRPKENVLTDYLHTALRLSTTLEQFGRRSAGSSYPAILENDIMVTLIPLPTKEQQKEIAGEIIRRRTQAKRLRTEAERVVAEAKARVELMLLGEEGA